MEFPSNRVNWGVIFLGALLGAGTTFLLTFLARAMSFGRAPDVLLPTGPAALPFTGLDAVLAVAIMLVGFTFGGAATSLLGRFSFRVETLLHSFAGFCLAAMAIHFFTRGALFVGHPGFPLDVAFQPELQMGRVFMMGPLLAWVAALSLVVGAIGNIAGAWMADNWLASGRLWTRNRFREKRELPRRAA